MNQVTDIGDKLPFTNHPKVVVKHKINLWGLLLENKSYTETNPYQHDDLPYIRFFHLFYMA